eukprot:3170894-Rhodomonas_salina.1
MPVSVTCLCCTAKAMPLRCQVPCIVELVQRYEGKGEQGRSRGERRVRGCTEEWRQRHSERREQTGKGAARATVAATATSKSSRWPRLAPRSTPKMLEMAFCCMLGERIDLQLPVPAC